MSSQAVHSHILVNGVSIAHTDSGGAGRPLLFIHGFAASSLSWMKLIGFMPPDFRFITLDLKGFGYSEKKCDDQLSLFDQARLAADFIRLLDLRDLVLVGHSMGGAVSLLTLFDEETAPRITGLVLINSAGVFHKLPEFIDDIAFADPESHMVKMADGELLVSLVMRQAFFDRSKIDDEIVGEYSSILRQPNARECLCAAARQISAANIRSFHEKVRGITVPSMIIWGKEDAIISFEEAQRLRDDMPGVRFELIPECGHSPQEELPEKTAGILSSFLGLGKADESPPSPPSEPEPSPSAVPAPAAALINTLRKMSMRRLIDRWSWGALALILVIKSLQLMKKIGFKSKMNGWRKITGVFLRREHSKFMLALFRLKYAGQSPSPATESEAKKIIIARLAEFIRKNPNSRWAISWGFFLTKRKKSIFSDIIEAEFSPSGDILRLAPHFDKNYRPFPHISDELVGDMTAWLVKAYNRTKHVDGHKRSWVIYKRLKRRARKAQGLSFHGYRQLRHIARRLMNASYIQFHTMSPEAEASPKLRMSTPDMRHCAHPGFGFMNIVCRLTPDLSEADLWCQYHHVPVDGMPMQEMLRNLKKEWGEAGPVRYPAVPPRGHDSEVIPCGKNIRRVKIYISFERLLKFRKYLNDKYYLEMGGPATVASMIIWGLARRKFFRAKKFIFPVDMSLITDNPNDRHISFIIISPRKYLSKKDPLGGFLKYQREFNQRVFDTRLGKSESHELFELFALMHPLFYHLVRHLMPKTLGELVGAAGLTILRDAEMFISPVSELHFDGFVALGRMDMPTEDGKTAGSVSICGTKEQTAEYINGFRHLAEYFQDYLPGA